MARLDIYDNPIEEDRHAFPYVMDIQSDLLYRFAERVCVPLAVPDAFPGMTERFNPAIAVNDQVAHLHPLGIAVFLRNELSHPRPIPATPADIGDGEDRLADVHSPEVPPSIRAGVLRLMQPGDQLWRCPRLGAPRGLLGVLGVGPRDVVIEWWLMDAQGGLIEAFWEEG